jgi:hypothetical protein
MRLPSQAHGLVAKDPSFSFKLPLGFWDGISKLGAAGQRLERNIVILNMLS